LNWLRNRGNI